MIRLLFQVARRNCHPINQTCVESLKKRSLLEGAYAPAFTAISRPSLFQGFEWKENAENLEVELKQCYRAQSRVSEQLEIEVADSRVTKYLLQEKESMIVELQNELSKSMDECSRLGALLEQKTKAIGLLMDEHNNLKGLEAATLRAENAEAENKELVDCWMLERMKDAENLNEANAIYEDMVCLEGGNLHQVSGQNLDGVVRQSEEVSEYYLESTTPTIFPQRIPSHEGGCPAITFEHFSGKLISGGYDRSIKMWDSITGSLNRTLYGSLGSVLDVTVTYDDKSIIAATSANSLYVWDLGTGQVRHALTGHVDKVCAVDASRVSNHNVVSAAYDHSIKVWNLRKGFCTKTLF